MGTRKAKSVPVKQQVLNGLRTSGWILVGFFTMVILLAGLTLITGRAGETALVRSKTSGWILLVIGSTIVVSTLSRWRKILPGWVSYAVLNGLHSISSGHLPNRPDVPIPLSSAVTLTLLFAATAVVSATFVKRRLNLLDRLALLSFPGGLVWAAFTDSSLLPLLIPFLAMLAAWAVNQFSGPRTRAILQIGLSTRPNQPSDSP